MALVSLLVLAISALAFSVDGSSRDAENSDIFIIAADGSGRRNLTKNHIHGDDHPALSPDGRTLAFTRDVEGDSGWESVATMRARGGPVRVRFGGSPEARAYQPTWSPDGRLIAFSTFNTDKVGIVRPDGSGLTWIPNAGGPTWLGSRRLALLTDFSDAGALAIVVANADGTERRVVVRGTDVGLMLIHQNSASPDGRTIVFGAVDGRQNFGRIYSMSPTARSRPRLVSPHYADVSWSPTGRRVVLAGAEDGGLSTARADGRRRRHFPATRRLYPQLPSWSPDGTRIAFIAYHSPSRHDLVVMNVRHRSLRVIARRVERRQPVWSRDGRRLYFVALS